MLSAPPSPALSDVVVFSNPNGKFTEYLPSGPTAATTVVGHDVPADPLVAAAAAAAAAVVPGRRTTTRMGGSDRDGNCESLVPLAAMQVEASDGLPPKHEAVTTRPVNVCIKGGTTGTAHADGAITLPDDGEPRQTSDADPPCTALWSTERVTSNPPNPPQRLHTTMERSAVLIESGVPTRRITPGPFR
jgi:hypothetical protein